MDRREDSVALVFDASKNFLLDGKAGTLSPFVRAEPQISLMGGVRNGAYIKSGFRHSLGLADFVGLSHEAFASYDSGVYGVESGFTGHYKAKLEWKVGERVSIRVPTFHISTPLSSFGDGRETESAVGIGVNISF